MVAIATLLSRPRIQIKIVHTSLLLILIHLMPDYNSIDFFFYFTKHNHNKHLVMLNRVNLGQFRYIYKS